MKRVLYLGLLGFISLSTHATQLPAGVIAEHEMTTYFAPEEWRGTYKLQLFSNGKLEKVDNKNTRTQLAVLSETVVHKVKESIENIKTDELLKPEGPMCMDAPAYSIKVQKSSGSELTIWKDQDCRESVAVDSTAVEVAKLMRNLKNVFSQF